VLTLAVCTVVWEKYICGVVKNIDANKLIWTAFFMFDFFITKAFLD
jgi:hypothetical protein